MAAAIPKRTLSTLMNALSSGVVPRRGLEYIAVGRRKETETFVSDLEDTAEGGGAFRFISGRFGNGKSFMTQMIRNYAMDKGFLVMDADLAINRRLTGHKKEGLNTYMELLKNMAYKARPDGGALEPILQEFVSGISEEGDVKENVHRRLHELTSDIQSLQYCRDFVIAVESYCCDFLDGKDDIPALRWMKGEIDTKTEAKRLIGISITVNDDNWYDFIKIWAEMSVKLGYKGLIVFIDEGVILYKLQNKASRSNNYERLLTIFNDIMQGKSRYLSMYVCGTPEFITDTNRGLYSYEALRSRLTEGRFENGYDNYLGPVINLRPLTNEEVFVLLGTIRDLHEQRYNYKSEVDDEKLTVYLDAVMNNRMSSELITPREITRDLISLLDTLHQNPQIGFGDLVKNRTVRSDANPDDDIIEDLDI